MQKEEEEEMVTPGEILGKSTDIKPGIGAYLSRDTNTVYASITGPRSVVIDMIVITSFVKFCCLWIGNRCDLGIS